MSDFQNLIDANLVVASTIPPVKEFIITFPSSGSGWGSGDITWNIKRSDGTEVINGTTTTNTGTQNVSATELTYDGSYVLNMIDSWGDGWDGYTIAVSSTDASDNVYTRVTENTGPAINVKGSPGASVNLIVSNITPKTEVVRADLQSMVALGHTIPELVTGGIYTNQLIKAEFSGADVSELITSSYGSLGAVELINLGYTYNEVDVYFDGMPSVFTDTNDNSYTFNIIGELVQASYTFDGLSKYNVKTAFVGTNVTSIGNNTFNGATSLTSINIPSSVTSIGINTFYNARSLTSITIPSSVSSIGDRAFSGATSLTSVTFGANSLLNIIGSSVFRDATSLTSINIPSSVTSIGSSAFSGATSLTSVTFGANSLLNNIGSSAFYNARSLTSVTIPDSVTSIGNYAFYGATSLTSITIPSSVTSIGTSAFNGATSLTTIYLTEDLTIGGTPYTIGTSGTFFGSGNVSFVQAPVILAICFPAGTPVTTDQGNIPIEKLKSHIHTIRGKSIVAITQTRLLNKHIVSIEKDALVKNVPSQTTHISNNHKVFFEGQMVKARDLVDVCEHVHFIPYNGEILYNVLLEKDGKMMINNLICETLSPKNIMALISRMNEGSEKNEKIRKLTSIINKNDKAGYKKFYASLK